MEEQTDLDVPALHAVDRCVTKARNLFSSGGPSARAEMHSACRDVFEDEEFRAHENIQKGTDKCIKEIDTLLEECFALAEKQSA